MEQYDRRQNLQFHGVPVRDSEDDTHTILEFDVNIDGNSDKKDISIAHRLSQKKSMGRTRNSEPKIKHLSIIVRFVSRYKQNQVYLIFKALRTSDSIKEISTNSLSIQKLNG